jgi:excisionase family DNA binding protein
MPKTKPIDPTTHQSFTSQQAAEILGIHSVQTLRNLANQGKIVCERPRNHRRFSRKALIDYARKNGLTSAFGRLTGRDIVLHKELQEIILGILGLDYARQGLTRDEIRASKLSAPHQNPMANLMFEDLNWTTSEFERALESLRTAKKIALFKPTSGRKRNNKKIHFILWDLAPTLGIDPAADGNYQIKVIGKGS